MNSRRLLGPPLTFIVLSGVAVSGATAGLLIEQGPISVVFAALAGLVIWRLLGVSVDLAGTELIVRNILRTFRFPVNQIDIQPRVVDPRREGYAAGSAVEAPEIPTASDDNTPRAAKWYMLEYDNDRYLIDALMARTPPNHEQAAWRIRRDILAARTDTPGGDSDDNR